MRFAGAVVAVIVILPAAAGAQVTDSLSQQGRHIIEMGLGVASVSEARVSPGQTSARAAGALVSLAYTRFVSSAVAIDVGATVLDADAAVDFSGTRASALASLLLGIGVSPRQLALTPSIRPFVSAAVGPYFRSTTEASGLAGTTARVESRMGARAGAGVRLHIARHVGFLIQGDYHAVGRFVAANGASTDLSRASLTLGVGISWGR